MPNTSSQTLISIDPRFAAYLSPNGMMPRSVASEILSEVAEPTMYGHYPDGIPPYILGRAIARTVFNYRFADLENTPSKEEIMRQFIAGFLSL